MGKNIPAATQVAEGGENHPQRHPRILAHQITTLQQFLLASKAKSFVSSLFQVAHPEQQLLIAETLQIMPGFMKHNMIISICLIFPVTNYLVAMIRMSCMFNESTEENQWEHSIKKKREHNLDSIDQT